MPHPDSRSDGASRASRISSASILAVAFFAAASFVLLASAPAEAAITSPGSNGVSKDRGFTIVPPWSRGESYSMTCGYGHYKHDNIGTQDHFAMDFPMATGDPILAVAPGRVVLAERLSASLPAGQGWEPYGKSVMIEHEDGYQSFYAHLDQISVAEGDEVDIDTQIGTAGQSGSGAVSTHLHFVIYKGASVGGWGTNRGPTGGQSVVPEPFSGCTKSGGGDCESIVNGNILRRDDYAPEAVVHADGSLELFTCGRTSRKLLHKRRTAGGSWSGWTDLGGVCASSPTAAIDASGRVYAFVRGVDSQLWHRRRDVVGGGWTGWSPLTTQVIGRPAAALDTASGVLRVFARRTTSESLYVASQVGTGFSAWSNLGGRLVNSPVAGRRADGRVDAFAAGTDYRLYKQPALGNGTFQYENWHPQSAEFEGEPYLVREGALQWLVRSTSDRLLLDGTNITEATHPPAGARKPDGRLHLFLRDRATSALDYVYETGWSWGVETFGGLVTSELEAVRAGSLDRVIVFTWGTGGLYSREQSATNGTTSWGPWVDLAVPN